MTAKELMKTILKDPDTAEFSPLWESKAISIDRINCIWKVKGWVRSQNSFGARLKKYYSIKLKNKKGTMEYTLIDAKFIQRY